MLAQQDGPRAVQHGAQRHRDDYRVVQRPRDRDEVGDEIDHDEVEENQRGGAFATSISADLRASVET